MAWSWMAVGFACPSISKSWKVPHNLVIEALPRQGLITGYNSLSATGDLKMADYDIPVYPGTMRYNPQVEDHGIIIGCLIFPRFAGGQVILKVKLIVVMTHIGRVSNRLYSDRSVAMTDA